MNPDDSKYWGLFENRPAMERTSTAPAEQTHGRGTCQSRTRRDADRSEREHIKC